MKNLVLILVLVLSYNFILAEEVDIDSLYEEKPQYSIGFNIGGLINLSDADFDNKYRGDASSISVNDTVARDGIGFGLNFRYSLIDWLSVGSNLDYSSFRFSKVDITRDNTNSTFNLGRANVVSFLAICEFRVPPSKKSHLRISPYFYFGGGFNFNIWEKPDEFNSDVEVDHSPAIIVGGGVEFYMNPNTTLQLEMNWNYNVADFNIPDPERSGDIYSGELDLSNVKILIGIRFYL